MWGHEPTQLLSHLRDPMDTRFDLLLLSDLLFNHSEHGKLVKSIGLTMKKSEKAVALVFFTPHRPWLYEKDLAFFEVANEAGLSVKKIMEHKLEAPMFEEDRGVSLCALPIECSN